MLGAVLKKGQRLTIDQAVNVGTGRMFLAYGTMLPIPSVYRPGGFFRSRLPDDIFIAAAREDSQPFMALILQHELNQNHAPLPIWDRIVLLDIAIQARAGKNALWILGRQDLQIDFSRLDYDTEAFSSSMLYECLDVDSPELYPVAVEMLKDLGENMLIEPVVHRPSNFDYWREMWNAFGLSGAQILLDPAYQQAHQSPMTCYYWHQHQDENVAGISFSRYIQMIQDELHGEYDSEEADDQSDLDDTDEESVEGAETDSEDADFEDNDK
ncbi:hypothetical protein BJ166DRAFT_616138 [Pestalotiopsis sp. NC0098]|nr:hypothetical protein BJ166DRAFT_616138 [Pestalotiopsis sp. NC0098]